MGQGVRIALGTDSLASNPDLDLLAEARFIHQRYPDVPGDQLLRMATLNGAEALGFGRITGSLVPGKSADLVVVSLPGPRRSRSVFASVRCARYPRRPATDVAGLCARLPMW